MLLMKPNQQISGVQPHGFLNALDDWTSFHQTVLEPSMSSPSDIDSFSQASDITSRLSAFPKYPLNTKASPADCWKNYVFQNKSRTSSPSPSAYIITSNDISISTVEEENTVMVTLASVSPGIQVQPKLSQNAFH